MKYLAGRWLSKMMSAEQIKVVVRVYTHLLDNEKRGWDGLDDYIDFLEYLDNDQLQREADVIYTKHSKGEVKCNQDHPKDKCFVPMLIDAVGAILDLYKENKSLHDKNKYILQYYLAMNQSGMILSENG